LFSFGDIAKGVGTRLPAMDRDRFPPTDVDSPAQRMYEKR
jgi:hypothetical protein